MSKIKVGILFGGKTPEHEVSLQSAKNIIEAIDKDKFDLTLIGINKKGRWLFQNPSNYLLNSTNPKKISLKKNSKELSLKIGDKLSIYSKNLELPKLDVIFPIIHGINGEDGSIQGLLQILDLPFVGPGILGSAVGMDKEITKILLKNIGILVAKSSTYYDYEIKSISYETESKKLGKTLFIKPANMGSSVGVSKVENKKDFDKAIKNAFNYDNKILIEEAIIGRELECSVLGNDFPEASLVGEVFTTKDSFYSYKAKYIDEKGSYIVIPADLEEDILNKIRKTAIKAFKSVQCYGMSRVDFFLTKNNKIYINEINTIPGFTNISMYPKLWEASGLAYKDLITKLIELAIEKYNSKNKLKKFF